MMFSGQLGVVRAGIVSTIEKEKEPFKEKKTPTHKNAELWLCVGGVKYGGVKHKTFLMFLLRNWHKQEL